MNPGDILLKLALVAAALSAGLFLLELRGRRASAAVWAFALHAALLVAATALLSAYFLTHRFEFEYVAQYSSRALSPALALAAVWAGQQGSILLWAAVSALLGIALLRQPGSLARPAMFFVSLGQLVLVALLVLKSPFVLSAVVPADGHGLNPLLEDPWMVVHPPVLFVGYAALLIPFGLAGAALARGDHRDWNRMVWPWSLFGVVSLGAGIALGGVWAYKVLGWGGYWGWDPVENASLVPWLVSVALLHGLMVQRATGGLARTNLVLAFTGWVTVLGGTYLTRSGVLQDFSVHSFTDSGLNAPLQFTLLGFTLIALGLLFRRWRAIGAKPATDVPVSRESALWLGMITVLILAGLVVVGTTAPLLTRIFGKPAGVQPAFYQSVTLPLGIALVVLMGLSPALRWYHQRGLSWIAGMVPGLAVSALVVALAVLAGVRQPGYLALIAVTGLALGVNATVALKLFRRGWLYGAGYVGHLGVGVMVLGMALSTALGKSERLTIAEGAHAQSLGYDIAYHGVQDGARGARTLDLRLEGRGFGLDARPALLPSPQGEGMIRKPAISAWREIYLSPVEVREQAVTDGGAVWLAKGAETRIGAADYTFVGFRMESQPDFRVYADLKVRKDGRTLDVAPAIGAGPSGSQPLDAAVPGLGPVSLARIDADQGRVAVVAPGAAATATLAVVELSTKPFINLVWVGALLAFAGTALAGIRRAGERMPVRTRPAAPRPGRERAVRAPRG